jgi:hypothetical protein
MAEARDYIMARLAAAKAYNLAVGDTLDTVIEAFVDPADDESGASRKEALEMASDASGEVSRSIELAQVVFDELTSGELVEQEPDLEDDLVEEGEPA